MIKYITISDKMKIKSILVISFMVISLLMISGCTDNNNNNVNDCELYTKNIPGFPCEYFIPIDNLPFGFSIEKDDEGNYLIEKIENDVTFGSNVSKWFTILYVNETDDVLSINILCFDSDEDRIESIKEIESFKELIPAIKYFSDNDKLILIIPLSDIPEEDVDVFIDLLKN